MDTLVVINVFLPGYPGYLAIPMYVDDASFKKQAPQLCSLTLVFKSHFLESHQKLKLIHFGSVKHESKQSG